MNDETTKADPSSLNSLKADPTSLNASKADPTPSDVLNLFHLDPPTTPKPDQLSDVLEMGLECLAVASGHIERRPKGLLFSQPEKLAMSKILTVMEKLCDQMGVL